MLPSHETMGQEWPKHITQIRWTWLVCFDQGADQPLEEDDWKGACWANLESYLPCLPAERLVHGFTTKIWGKRTLQEIMKTLSDRMSFDKLLNSWNDGNIPPLVGGFTELDDIYVFPLHERQLVCSLLCLNHQPKQFWGTSLHFCFPSVAEDPVVKTGARTRERTGSGDAQQFDLCCSIGPFLDHRPLKNLPWSSTTSFFKDLWRSPRHSVLLCPVVHQMRQQVDLGGPCWMGLGCFLQIVSLQVVSISIFPRDRLVLEIYQVYFPGYTLTQTKNI